MFRMRIGVVHTVDEDHPAVRGHDALGQLPAVQAARGEAVEVGDLRAVDELCRQHAARRALGDDYRKADGRIAGKVARHPLDVARLLREIQFFGDHLADFGMIRLDTAHAGEELDELEQAPNDLEVAARDAFDVGMLRLDGESPSVAERGGVHLSE